jgi:hypothetical protein
MSGIPYPGTAELERVARRTTVVRTALAVAAVVLLVAAALVAWTPRLSTERFLPARTNSGLIVLDLSASVSSDTFSRIGTTLRALSERNGRYGLVVFSNSAYEALPPGTPAAELKPYLRFFQKRGTSNPWVDAFAGGTRIWTALDLARRMLKRDRIANGSVVLISDLADAPNDRAELAQTLVSYARDSIPIEIVALDPTPEDAQLFRGALTYGGGSVTTVEPTSSGVRSPRASPAFPLAVVAAVAAFVLLLGVNEHALGSLRWGRRREA